jgi:hypothetical protein
MPQMSSPAAKVLRTQNDATYTMPKIGSQFEKKIESTRAIVTKEENSFAF